MNSAAVSTPMRQLLRNWSIVALLLMAATAGGFLLDHHVSLTSQAMV